MAKMGRRKRSRLITQGMITSGKTVGAAVVESAEAVVSRVAEPIDADGPVAVVAEISEPVAAGAPDIKALAERVKARRRENGWTQAEVAKKGGPSAGVISQIERCLVEAPAGDVLGKLDAALEWVAGTADGILRGAPAGMAGAGK
ncbi:helix-turn-helix domain-containing protein [Nocardia sp. NPDC046763]|uniref:helix-turn-helix domain-containing protein n=1 Tax=Nocardia sp. NPDC046763 TaxID=3155256 RepID=UPI0033D2D572